ncbi:MAG: helix-turn-helix transcriptional regulator [Alphaproteobacteria bacterium]|nr:helix-turn-helix transcriptional regulator [Alphaproteobacteria bacterium]
MKLHDIFCANLRHYRHAAGLSQEQLAHEADINRTYISKLEKGISQPGLEIIGKIADVLGVEAHLLLKPSARRK